jgi:flavin reductase
MPAVPCRKPNNSFAYRGRLGIEERTISLCSFMEAVAMQKELCGAMAKFGKGDMLLGPARAPEFDRAVFREAMSRIAASVNIVTTDGPAGLAGITATAVASITLEPPMMLFCINKSSPSAERMIENGVFCINTLGSAHEMLADIFAGRMGNRLGERFTHGEWTKLVTGSPVLRGAAAAFDCRLAEAKEVMTHLIMIGAVEALDFTPGGKSLIYAHRKYGTI